MDNKHSGLEYEDMTVDEPSGNRIRPTDNSLKPGDKQSPQGNKPLSLDENGLPLWFDQWQEVQ